ncbi:heterokaryon incompatibility protein-domain-containing protein, partial [Schizothecium vesticola]
MRLLNTNTLGFEEFFGEAGNGIPYYAILSHTWGPDEVSYRDHADGIGPSRQGWAKVRDASKLANEEGFEFLWIDTCCIDKSSSAELSEAINSMFRWYRDAAICYAYLGDVLSSEDPTLQNSSFSRSRWFTRGWTLQELLAPKELVFVGSDWAEIGTKKSLQVIVSAITQIDVEALDKQSWPEYSIAQKMSWAVGRQTTRLEDEAYCLLGLFNVNMPMLYGEGRRAFSRLQQEILQQSDDQSLFTWTFPEPEHSHINMSGLLAPSPEQFRH